ncbi:hypothetical protein JL721_1426 [Aureococcus anophagefferens]|nr:hypothetical protein JL721_1426 [Aureococcus anophagefferens]
MWPCLLLIVAVGADGSEGKAAVADAMRRAVAAAGSTHPLEDPHRALGDREILVATTPPGDVFVDAGGRGSCTQKCALFLDQFLSMLAARRRCGAAADLPAAAFFFREHSAGCGADDARCAASPTLVIAKVADAAPGIMAPNPYFGTFPAWEARAARVREAAARPAAERTRKVFWRGSARPSEDANATGCAAPLEVDGHASPGLEVRMAALSLALRYPETFDVAAVFKHEDPALHRRQLVDWLRCDAARAASRERGRTPSRPARRGSHRGPRRAVGVSRHAVLASLPGDTHGSFSQHLNHLWAAGSAVLLWRWAESRPLYSEWYYAGLELCLEDGATHVEVRRAGAAVLDVADRLLGDGARRARLGAAAAEVHDALLCPCCLNFYADLLRELGNAQRGFDVAAGLDRRAWQEKRVYETDGDPKLRAEQRRAGGT